MMLKGQMWADGEHSVRRGLFNSWPRRDEKGGGEAADWLMSALKHTHTHTGSECADQSESGLGSPTDGCLRLTQSDCIIHERPPLKERLGSQPLKTNETGRHTHFLLLYLKPPLAYQSEQTRRHLSTITASSCPPEHHSPLTLKLLSSVSLSLSFPPVFFSTAP